MALFAHLRHSAHDTGTLPGLRRGFGSPLACSLVLAFVVVLVIGAVRWWSETSEVAYWALSKGNHLSRSTQNPMREHTAASGKTAARLIQRAVSLSCRRVMLVQPEQKS